MCTAVSYKVNDLYFGRTFDYEASYGEEIVFMPENILSISDMRATCRNISQL